MRGGALSRENGNFSIKLEDQLLVTESGSKISPLILSTINF